MEPELDAVLRSLRAQGQLLPELGLLRGGLLQALDGGSASLPPFRLPVLALPSREDETSLLRAALFDDASIRCAASRVLADRLYRIGVPRDVGDHEPPGPWAMFGLLLSHAADRNAAGSWAQRVQPAAPEALGSADVSLLGLLLDGKALRSLAMFSMASGGLGTLVAGVASVQALRDAPAEAAELPEPIARRFFGARYLRGLRRRAARMAGLGLRREQRDVPLPAWLHWSQREAPPAGLLAAAAEWLSAAQRSPLADLTALLTACDRIEEFAGLCRDHRVKGWVQGEIDEIRRA